MSLGMRYLTRTIDKAEELEGWVISHADKVSRGLNGAKLHSVSLTVEDPPFYSGQGEEGRTGFISVYIDFGAKEPNFIIPQDRVDWWSSMRDVAGRRFKELGTGCGTDLRYTSINLGRASGEERYKLTQSRRDEITLGFEKVKCFVDWYVSSVRDYNEKVGKAHEETMRQHLARIEEI